MTASAQATAIIDELIATNRKAAFGDPATLDMLLEASRKEQETIYEIPEFVHEQAFVSEGTAEDGTRCIILAPCKLGASSKSDAPQEPIVAERTPAYSGAPRTHILYYHGGGFIMQIGASHWELCLRLMNELQCTIVVPLYPLAPTYTYREAYRSMMAAYRFTLERCGAENLVVMGDSAGGHLAIAAAQTALLEGLPQPARIVAFSPWLDMADELPDRDDRAEIDPLIGAYGMRKIPLDWAPGAKDSPSFPPCVLHGPFEGMAPLLVISGSREFLLSDSEACVKNAQRAGVSTEWLVYEGMWHVFPLMGETPEREDAIAAVLDAIRSSRL